MPPPENAGIYFVEDDKDSRETSTIFLQRRGHTVVEIAESLNDALAKIPNLGKKKVTVAIVDGNLSPADESGRDGETVARQIKAQHPEIIVIGHALRNPIKAADINCPKLDGSLKLADLILRAKVKPLP